MPFQWFVMQTLSGQESKVKESIEKRMVVEEVSEFIEEVLVPIERVAEVKNGKKMVTNRKLYPGYAFISVDLYDDNKRLRDKPWYFLRETQGLIGFVGGDHPTPTPDSEIDDIKSQISDAQDVERPKVNFEVNEIIKINDGPFLGNNGTIEEVDADKGKLKVQVSIFGRNTPVELEYWQVEKTS